jgi:hydroxyacylglutathione hydrolase
MDHEVAIMKIRLYWMMPAALLMSLAVGCFAAHGRDIKGGAGLKGLELSTDLSPAIKFEPAFASSVHEYSAIIDSANVKSVWINPIPLSNQDAVTINDAEVSPAKPFKAELRSGENTFAISVASPNQNSVQYILTITQKDLSGQYKTELVQNGIWRISDYAGFPPNQDAYLIEGSAKAVLIDTTMGKGNLAQLVKSITSLPIEVAITHGHGDHIAQMGQFAGSVVYMSEKDKAMVPATLDTSKFQWVKDGDKIDLGAGRMLDVIDVPGHSAGSIMFLDSVRKTLAVGDAIGSGMYVWKFIPGSSSVAEYGDTLKKLEARLAGIDALTFLTGHHWQERIPLAGASGKQLVTDMRILCEKIISGEIVGTATSANIGARKINVLTASYGLAGMWYDPSNIQAKK